MRDDPARLEVMSPLTWQYLLAHAGLLQRRASSIYKKRAPFSVFGVGPYTFASWKVAVSGLYKALRFVEVPSWEGRPVVLDDTCYFFPCDDAGECRELRGLLESEPARDFLTAFIFWDSKRPITARLLNMLDLGRLARELGRDWRAIRSMASQRANRDSQTAGQMVLFQGHEFPAPKRRRRSGRCGSSDLT